MKHSSHPCNGTSIVLVFLIMDSTKEQNKALKINCISLPNLDHLNEKTSSY